MCDNQSTVLMAYNPIKPSRTKHMDIAFFFCQGEDLGEETSSSPYTWH